MPSPQNPSSEFASQQYLFVPNLHVSGPSAHEVDLGAHQWMVATVIEDDDLMFGGKPLSTWYEEERRRQSSSDGEQPRGRTRERSRARHDGHQQNHRHHGHKTAKDAK